MLVICTVFYFSEMARTQTVFLLFRFFFLLARDLVLVMSTKHKFNLIIFCRHFQLFLHSYFNSQWKNISTWKILSASELSFLFFVLIFFFPSTKPFLTLFVIKWFSELLWYSLTDLHKCMLQYVRGDKIELHKLRISRERWTLVWIIWI